MPAALSADGPRKLEAACKAVGSRRSGDSYRNTDFAFEVQDLFLGKHQVLCSSIVLSTLCSELRVLMLEAGMELRHLQGVPQNIMSIHIHPWSLAL